MKTCTKCGVEKELTEFNKQSASSDAVRARCKGCTKEDRLARVGACYERSLEYGLVYYAANREQICARKKSYYEANRAELLARSRDLRMKDPKKYCARSLAWSKDNRGKANAIEARRRAAKLRGKREDDPRILQLYKIAACMRTQGHDVHVDHKIPLQPADPNVVPGTDTYDNLQIISAEANMRKGNRGPRLSENSSPESHTGPDPV